MNLLIDIGADVSYSNEEDFSDSPIYQAVLSKEKEVVTCLLSRNLSNRQQLKKALSLARMLELDGIIGVLLKGLGLDKQRRFLNLGGLDLVEIKPSWIHPSLGVRSGLEHRVRRHKSMEHVAEMINKRNSTDNSLLMLHQLSENGSLSLSFRATGSKNQNEIGSQSTGPETIKTPSTTADSENKSSIEATFDNESVPPVRYRQKYSQGASRAPRLPTVICSPLATTKASSLPSMSVSLQDISPDGEDGFMGSMPKNEVDQQPKEEAARDEVDYDSDNDSDVTRQPDRRHCGKTFSTTGATHVLFSTLAKYNSFPGDPTGSITSLINQEEKANETGLYSLDSKSVAAVAPMTRPGSQLIHYAAQKSKHPANRYGISRSSSPFLSSGEQGSTEGCSISLSLSRSDVVRLSTQDQSAQPSEDLVDGPVVPPPTIITPASQQTLKYLDLSSNKLQSLDSLVERNRRIIKSLQDLTSIDLKQNSLSQLPSVFIEVISMVQVLFKILLVLACVT